MALPFEDRLFFAGEATHPMISRPPTAPTTAAFASRSKRSQPLARQPGSTEDLPLLNRLNFSQVMQSHELEMCRGLGMDFCRVALWMQSSSANCGLADRSRPAGAPETDIVAGFCDRCVAAGISLDRTCLSIRSIQSTKGACFAGAIQTNPRCTSTAAPGSRGLMQ